MPANSEWKLLAKMNSKAIAEFSVWAHQELLRGAKVRLFRLGINSPDGALAYNSCSNEAYASEQWRAQKEALVKLCAQHGADWVCERAAALWFCRLVIIRFMELHDYLPCHMRLLSSCDGSLTPQALSEALDVRIEGLDASAVFDLVRAGNDEASFKYLFFSQCHELALAMPVAFSSEGDAFELLFPDGVLRKGGIVDRLVRDIPEDDWLDAESIMGWLYQGYASQRKDEVFAGFSKRKKASATDIAPATQVFTPTWIAQHLVKDSVGRWCSEASRGDASCSLENVSVCDPACGSGRVLACVFDYLMLQYEQRGYSKRDAVRLILEKNLTGFEIDAGAAALASFMLVAKALECDRRFLGRGVAPRIILLESIEFSCDELACMPSLNARRRLLEDYSHFSERGSLVRPSREDVEAIVCARDEYFAAAVSSDAQTLEGETIKKLDRAAAVLQQLSKLFDCVASYPPYMPTGNVNDCYARYLKSEYSLGNKNIGTVFLERGLTFNAGAGYTSMIVSQSWLFLKSFKNMRKSFLANNAIASVLDIGSGGFDNFGSNLMTAIAITLDAAGQASAGAYIDVTEPMGEQAKADALACALTCPEGRVFKRSSDFFERVPDYSLNYKIDDIFLDALTIGVPVSELASNVNSGQAISGKDRFVRYWHEVGIDDSSFENDALREAPRWRPYSGGGEFRAWYGNLSYVVDWESVSGKKTKNADVELEDVSSCASHIAWNRLCTTELSFRIYPGDPIVASNGPSFDFDLLPGEDRVYAIIAFLNSSSSRAIGEPLCPTLNKYASDIGRLPIADEVLSNSRAAELARDCVSLSKLDWDSFETPWDFKRNPLV